MASSHCFENPPALNPAGGVGEVVDDFGGMKAYVAGSAGSKAAVVLVSDAFGNLISPCKASWIQACRSCAFASSELQSLKD